MEVIALLVAGWLNRIRGGWPEGRPSWIAILAAYASHGLLALAVGAPLLWCGAAALAGGAWNSFPLKHDAGWRGDWVRGSGSVLEALKAGALWAAPYAVLGWWAHELWALAAVAPIGALVAIWIATKLPASRVLELRNPWPWSELLEPIVIGAVSVILLFGNTFIHKM